MVAAASDRMRGGSTAVASFETSAAAAVVAAFDMGKMVRLPLVAAALFS